METKEHKKAVTEETKGCKCGTKKSDSCKCKSGKSCDGKSCSCKSGSKKEKEVELVKFEPIGPCGFGC